MVDYDDFDERNGLSRSHRIEACLEFGGWVVILIAIIWGFTAVVQVSRVEETSARTILALIAKMLCGVWAGVALWGLGMVMRRLAAIQDAGERAAARPEASMGRARPVANSMLPDTDDMEEMIVLLREVRDISLLTEEQRSLRLQAQGKAALSLLQREVPVLLREHNWIEARNRVQVARERFPSFAEWDALERKIEQMRAQVEARDIEDAERQIADLTSLGAWDRVAEVVNELLERHPDAPRANELAQGLRAERNKAEAQQRTKLMEQAQQASNQREWKSALSAATALIQRFPKSPEAQALRMQLPTLQENAEIQIRQQMESQIRDLIKQQRFDEALRVTHELLQQYPDSPQASVLREQLPRLEEKAHTTGSRY